MNNSIKDTITEFYNLCDEFESMLINVEPRIPDTLRNITKHDFLIFLLKLLPMDVDLTEEDYFLIVDYLDVKYNFEEVKEYFYSEYFNEEMEKNSIPFSVEIFEEISNLNNDLWEFFKSMLMIYKLLGISFLKEISCSEYINEQKLYKPLEKNMEYMMKWVIDKEKNINKKNEISMMFLLFDIENTYMEELTDEELIDTDKIEKIICEIEDNCENTEVSIENKKIQSKTFTEILDRYILNDDEEDMIYEKMDDRSIIKVDRFEVELDLCNKVCDYLDERKNFDIYIDDFRKIINKFEIKDDALKEALYVFLKTNYNLKENNSYIEKIRTLIISNDNIHLLSKEKYEEVVSNCDGESAEEIEDYIDSNKIHIFKNTFIHFLKLLDVTVFLLDYKISEEIIDDFIFEYDLNTDEVECLKNWLEKNEIEIIKDPKFPFDKIEYNKIISNENNASFLENVFEKLSNSIPKYENFQIRSMYQKFIGGDMYYFDKIMGVGFNKVYLIAKKYKGKQDFFKLLRDGVAILEKIIKKNNIDEKSLLFEDFIEFEIENAIRK